MPSQSEQKIKEIRMNKKLLVLAVFVTAMFAGSLSANDKILGKWATEGGKSHVELSKCGDAICGTIVWLKEPNYPADATPVKEGKATAGSPKVDTENPNAALRTKPIVGLTFLKGFKYNSEDDEWTEGEIYDPESGKLYVGELKMNGDNSLKLNGHLKISKWLGKKQTWTRVK
ncbi:MAG: DUF2147 domain-containing protein [Leptospiraceae bacterium]|nr:DUF2147 domain-containing protein [Leptospiraceae bacterium]